eukprot:gene15792-43778_t
MTRTPAAAAALLPAAVSAAFRAPALRAVHACAQASSGVMRGLRSR